MRTGAPGRFECEVYLKAWQLDLRGPDVMHHIDNCLWCGTLINGHPGEFPLPIVEEARIRMAERAEQQAALRQRRRRRFLAGAASVLGLIAIGVGVHHGRSSGPAGTPTPLIDAEEALTTLALDRMHAVGGDTAVRSRIASMSSDQLRRTTQWVADRHHAGLYPDVVAMLGDPRLEVKQFAVAALYQVPTADLAAHEAALIGFSNTEPDPDVREAYRALVRHVRGQ